MRWGQTEARAKARRILHLELKVLLGGDLSTLFRLTPSRTFWFPGGFNLENGGHTRALKSKWHLGLRRERATCQYHVARCKSPVLQLFTLRFSRLPELPNSTWYFLSEQQNILIANKNDWNFNFARFQGEVKTPVQGGPGEVKERLDLNYPSVKSLLNIFFFSNFPFSNTAMK